MEKKIKDFKDEFKSFFVDISNGILLDFGFVLMVLLVLFFFGALITYCIVR